MRPLISIIVPIHNGSEFISQCLDALATSSYQPFEIIVVNDCSTDNSGEISRSHRAEVFDLPFRSGPAAARNYGAKKAQGEFLLFIDADVLVGPDTIARVVQDLTHHPQIAAVFGSYDDDPAATNFLSQYKNLFHHFVHQQSDSNATTFWTGCGAVRREVFEAIGGFDPARYFVEDIELGYRLSDMGHKILLDRDIQVKHLKQWRLGSLLRADILGRAVPWTKLILERRRMRDDLNLRVVDRLCAGLVGLLLVILICSLFEHQLIYGVLFLLAAILICNRDLYRFYYRRKGITFAALAFPLHLLYYFYSSATFLSCWCSHVFTCPVVSMSRVSGNGDNKFPHDGCCASHESNDGIILNAAGHRVK